MFHSSHWMDSEYMSSLVLPLKRISTKQFLVAMWFISNIQFVTCRSLELVISVLSHPIVGGLYSHFCYIIMCIYIYIYVHKDSHPQYKEFRPTLTVTHVFISVLPRSWFSTFCCRCCSYGLLTISEEVNLQKMSMMWKCNGRGWTCDNSRMWNDGRKLCTIQGGGVASNSFFITTTTKIPILTNTVQMVWSDQLE